MFVISAGPGEEIMESFDRQLADRGIQTAAIASLIGAVDSYCISNMPKDDATDDVLSEYQQPAELSGTGEVVDGQLHVHAVLGTQGDGALAGHLHWARVETHFVRAYVMPVD